MKMFWMLFVICCNFVLVASVSEPPKTCPASCLLRMNNIKKTLQKQINKYVTKKINELKDDIENLKDKLNNLSGGDKDNGFPDSVILRGEPKFQEKLTSWVGEGKKWKLCWQATKDGWGSKIFHSKCDYKAPTLIIVKVDRYIFGGYATASWDGNYVSKQAPESFIFSLRNKENLSPFKAPLIDQNYYQAIFAYPDFVVYFGGGSDLFISHNADTYNISYANLGNSYQPPSGVSDPKTVLAGTKKFAPSEVEVFYPAV